MTRPAAPSLTLVGTLVLALGALLGSDAVLAQAAAPASAAAPQPMKTVRAMYAFADQNKDGRLTRDEANHHLPFTHADFATIDTDKRGWISFEQFLAYTNRRVGKQADDTLHSGDRL